MITVKIVQMGNAKVIKCEKVLLIHFIDRSLMFAFIKRKTIQSSIEIFND